MPERPRRVPVRVREPFAGQPRQGAAREQEEVRQAPRLWPPLFRLLRPVPRPWQPELRRFAAGISGFATGASGFTAGGSALAIGRSIFATGAGVATGAVGASTSSAGGSGSAAATGGRGGGVAISRREAMGTIWARGVALGAGTGGAAGRAITGSDWAAPRRPASSEERNGNSSQLLSVRIEPSSRKKTPARLAFVAKGRISSAIPFGPANLESRRATSSGSIEMPLRVWLRKNPTGTSPLREPASMALEKRTRSISERRYSGPRL